MTEYLPDVPSAGPGAVKGLHRARVTRSAQRAEIEVFNHRLEAAVRREKDIADTEALADAIAVATDEELAFLREFRAKAGGSAAAMEIVGRKLEIFDTITNRRITRRFS